MRKNYISPKIVVGWVLLMPPILSVFFFIFSVFGLSEEVDQVAQLGKLRQGCNGDYEFDKGGVDILRLHQYI